MTILSVTNSLSKVFTLICNIKNVKELKFNNFLESSTVKHIEGTLDDLTEYLKEVKIENIKDLKEAYGFLGKPEARKVKTYLQKIIDDAKQYHYDRRPGRRKRNLNSSTLGINRGFELMLRQEGREEEPEPKKFHVIFGKVLSLFRREIKFSL